MGRHPAVEITDRQTEVLEFIRAFISEHGYAPSYRDIMRAFRFASTNASQCTIAALLRKGYLRKTPNIARSFIVTEKSGETLESVREERDRLREQVAELSRVVEILTGGHTSEA